MKRWRRLLLVIALLLLAGAVVNVAVAWVLGGAPKSWTPGGPSVNWYFSGMSDEAMRRIAERVSPPSHWAPPILASVEQGRGWTKTLLSHDNGGKKHDLAIRVDSGWPARSMMYVTMLPESERPLHSPSIDPPDWLLPSFHWFHDDLRFRAPLIPVPSGFVLNTLFYAAVVGVILSLPLVFFPIRRRLRARCGRCPECGYDLAGLAGADPAAPCPECGAAR